MNPDDIKKLLSHDSRVLVMTAHPDDGTIGAGALLMQLRSPYVIHASKRSSEHHEEAIRALAIAGIPQSSIASLELPEQQITFQMEELTLRILDLLRNLEPSVLLTHAYEGGHPDHDSVAFACHVAQGLYHAEVGAHSVHLLEFAGYHGDQTEIRPYEFISHSYREEYIHSLIPYEQQLKTEMLKMFKTQAKAIEIFLPPRIERFRIAPDYDFIHAPHPGKLLYELPGRGIDGLSWRNYAKRALKHLQLLKEAPWV